MYDQICRKMNCRSRDAELFPIYNTTYTDISHQSISAWDNFLIRSNRRLTSDKHQMITVTLAISSLNTPWVRFFSCGPTCSSWTSKIRRATPIILYHTHPLIWDKWGVFKIHLIFDWFPRRKINLCDILMNDELYIDFHKLDVNSSYRQT